MYVRLHLRHPLENCKVLFKVKATRLCSLGSEGSDYFFMIFFLSKQFLYFLLFMVQDIGACGKKVDQRMDTKKTVILIQHSRSETKIKKEERTGNEAIVYDGRKINFRAGEKSSRL